MPHKRTAIIVAISLELAPLIRGVRSQKADGVDLFELPEAVVAISGIGRKSARRAAEAAFEYATPKLLLSAGIAGALSPQLKVGDVGRIREVVDVATGARYPTSGGGEWVLVTSSQVSDVPQNSACWRSMAQTWLTWRGLP